MHGVVSIIAKQLEFSFSESYCVIEMAEVGASAPSVPGQVACVDLTGSPRKPAKNKPNAIVSQKLPAHFLKDKFCLRTNGYIEIFHPDLRGILPIKGVDEWGSLCEVDLDGNSVLTDEKLMISLVGFNVANVIPRTNTFHVNWRDEAKKLVRDMLCEVFDNEDDHNAIANCLENHPTWAIFAGRQKRQRKTRKGRKQEKGIFSCANNVSCLAAVVYYGPENNYSHILWLGTTVDPPPIESKHSSWRSIGLASFLVAVLVKQQLCHAHDGVQVQSTVTVQASAAQKKAVSFYKKLGFIDITAASGSVPSMLPRSFVTEAESNSHLWMESTDDNHMLCLRLRDGQIRFWEDNTVDLTDDDNEKGGSLKKKSESGKMYVRFPFKCTSTKKLEACCERLHVLNSFCPGRLPLTDRGFDPQTNFATPSGCINQEMRMTLTSDCWLRTDGTAFLYAWLTRSKECCGHFLVVPSQVTSVCGRAQLLHIRLKELGKAPEDYSSEEEGLLHSYMYLMEQMEVYFQQSLDMFEKKFILYENNISNEHWQTLVSVHAGDIAYPHLSNPKDRDISGYVVIDSMGATSGMPHLYGKEKGDEKERHDPYSVASGFKFFLNLAYNYHMARDKAQAPAFNFGYDDEPYGPLHHQGTPSFPQLVFDQRVFVAQQNGNDCGFGAIGNAIAFVTAFQDAPFKKSVMTQFSCPGDCSTYRPSCEIQSDYFATIAESDRMVAFWKTLMDFVSTREDTIWSGEDMGDLWKMLRWEFILLIDRLALLNGLTEEDRKHVVRGLKSDVPYSSIPILPCNDDFRKFLQIDDAEEASDDGSNSITASSEASDEDNIPPQEGQKMLVTDGSKSDGKVSPTEGVIKRPPQTEPSRKGSQARELPTRKHADRTVQEEQKEPSKDMKKRKGASCEQATEDHPNKKKRPTGQVATNEHDVVMNKRVGVCCALQLCLSIVTEVYPSENEEGEEANGTNCSVCSGLFHYCCLFHTEGTPFCTKCYKVKVVSCADAHETISDIV